MLTQDERYARTQEYIQIVKQAWTRHEPFDHDGEHYHFDDFVSDVFPVAAAAARDLVRRLVGRGVRGRRRRRPTSTACGASRWPTPPSRSSAMPRPRPPRAAPTARGSRWRSARSSRHRGSGVGEGARHRRAHRRPPRRQEPLGPRRQRAGSPAAPRVTPENTGSQRLLAIAERGERFDRALFTGTAAATGGAGNSNALVGTPETVAAALLDYVDLGVDILSARGYDLLEDAVEFGRTSSRSCARRSPSATARRELARTSGRGVRLLQRSQTSSGMTPKRMSTAKTLQPRQNANTDSSVAAMMMNATRTYAVVFASNPK